MTASVRDQIALVIAPPGLAVEAVTAGGLAMWRAAVDLHQSLDWAEPDSVLIRLADGVVAVAPPLGRSAPLLVLANWDNSQVGTAALRLDKLRGLFPAEGRDHGFADNAGQV